LTGGKVVAEATVRLGFDPGPLITGMRSVAAMLRAQADLIDEQTDEILAAAILPIITERRS
jgi:hypothetical protein